MTTTAVLPVALPQFFGENGQPLSGGLLYSYEAGTAYAVMQPLYQDGALSVEFDNPIVLNSAGRPSGPVYPALAPSYDLVVTDANGVMIWTA